MSIEGSIELKLVLIKIYKKFLYKLNFIIDISRNNPYTEKTRVFSVLGYPIQKL